MPRFGHKNASFGRPVQKRGSESNELGDAFVKVRKRVYSRICEISGAAFFGQNPKTDSADV